jgi:hypothetical protein
VQRWPQSRISRKTSTTFNRSCAAYNISCSSENIYVSKEMESRERGCCSADAVENCDWPLDTAVIQGLHGTVKLEEIILLKARYHLAACTSSDPFCSFSPCLEFPCLLPKSRHLVFQSECVRKHRNLRDENSARVSKTRRASGWHVHWDAWDLLAHHGIGRTDILYHSRRI